jgi:hypothetical protein
MAQIRYKVLYYERDGQEFSAGVELDLNGENVFFDNTDTGLTAENLTDAIKELLTNFESYSSSSLQTTTSNGWITKSGNGTTDTGYPFLTTIKPAGVYVVDYVAKVGQTKKSKLVGSRLEYRIGGTGTWIVLEKSEVINSFSLDNDNELRSGWDIIEIASDDTIEFRWQFGQTTNGGIGVISYADIKLSKVKGI